MTQKKLKLLAGDWAVIDHIEKLREETQRLYAEANAAESIYRKADDRLSSLLRERLRKEAEAEIRSLPKMNKRGHQLTYKIEQAANGRYAGPKGIGWHYPSLDKYLL